MRPRAEGAKGRRSKGEGSVYQETSTGRWVAVVDAGYRNGKRYRPRRIAKTEAEALLKRDAMKDDLRRNGSVRDVDVERQTVQQYLEAWLRDVVAIELRPRTARTYSDLVRLHIVPQIGRLQLRRLNPQNVQEMMRTLTAKGLAPHTVNSAKKVLGRALEQAREWQLIRDNPASVVRGPRIIARQARALTLAEVAKFLEVARGDRLFALYAVSIFTGIRQAEAFGLRWEDIDLARGTLMVQRQLQRVDRAFRIIEPKSRASRRTVGVPSLVVDALEQHRDRQLLEAKRAGDLWVKDWGALVFTREGGAPLHGRTVLTPFKAHLRTAQLPEDTRWHDLRHTHATMLAAGGVPARAVMDRLGHSAIAMTQDVYTHVLPDQQREVTVVIDAMLGPLAHLFGSPPPAAAGDGTP